jgi:lipoprotein-anchoring transpeptidase ErfK/SrfK
MRMGTHRKHANKRLRIGWLPVLLTFSALLVLLLAGAAFAGYRYDRASSSLILPGVSIAGVDVGGMTRDQALTALQPVSQGLLDRTIDVHAGNRTWTVSAGTLGTKVAVKQAVSDAMAVQDSLGWPSRVYHRLLHRPVTKDISLTVTQNRAAVSKFAHGITTDTARPAKDASIDFVNNELVVAHSRQGASVSESNIRSALLKALRNGRPEVNAKVKTVAPAVTEKDLGMTIVIRTTTNKLYLYDGVKLVKTYDVATGAPQYPTPHGHFEIINKRINPTWINPALETWGKNEPAMIPPGPDNPLGTRALDLNAPGIRIHGTPNDASIGTAASHGCIRMHIPDSEELFGRVDVGTQVFIAY